MGAPGGIHRGGVTVEERFKVVRKGVARLGRALIPRRFVEELVGVWGCAMRLELLRAGTPHFGIERAALVRDETVRHEVAGAAWRNGGGGGFTSFDGQERPMRPSGAGEVDDCRQSRQPPIGGDSPVKGAMRLPELRLGTELLHPCHGDFAADGVESDPLQIRAVGLRLVDPGVFVGIAVRVAEVAFGRLVVDDCADQVAGMSIDDEVPVRRYGKGVRCGNWSRFSNCSHGGEKCGNQDG